MKRLYRVTEFFLVTGFLPFFRSCGDVSMGFPAAALSGGSVFSIDSVNWKSLAINVFFMVLFSVAVLMIADIRKPGKILTSGTRGIIIYNAIILAGYFVTYPLYMVFHNSFMEYAAGIHLYALYPLHEVVEFSSLDNISESMSIYGDIYDIKLRLNYVLMIFVWFGAGCLAGYISSIRERNNKKTGVK